MLLAFGGRPTDHSWVSLTSSQLATWLVRTAVYLLVVWGCVIKLSGRPTAAWVVGRKQYNRDLLPKMAGRLLFGITARLNHRLRSKQYHTKDATPYLLGATCRSLNGSIISPITALICGFLILCDFFPKVTILLEFCLFNTILEEELWKYFFRESFGTQVVISQILICFFIFEIICKNYKQNATEWHRALRINKINLIDSKFFVTNCILLRKLISSVHIFYIDNIHIH